MNDQYFYCLQCEEYQTEAMVEFIEDTPICVFCDDEELIIITQEDYDNFSNVYYPLEKL